MRKPDFEMPEPFASLVDRVCTEDREWFEAHPGATVRERSYVEGEFHPAYYPAPNGERYPPGWPIPELKVTVTLVRYGVRTRKMPAGLYVPQEHQAMVDRASVLPQKWQDFLDAQRSWSRVRDDGHGRTV